MEPNPVDNIKRKFVRFVAIWYNGEGVRVAVARNDICKNERGGGGERHARTREPKAFHGWLRKYKKTSGFNSPAERRTMLVGFNVGFTFPLITPPLRRGSSPLPRQLTTPESFLDPFPVSFRERFSGPSHSCFLSRKERGFLLANLLRSI